MYLIHVTTTFAADRQAVFDALCDHETFFTSADAVCRLAVRGRDDRNGIGAVREIRSRGLVFQEEITAFDPPNGFDYAIRSVKGTLGLSLPVEHERGWLEFFEEDGGTRVEWRSRFRIKLPVVGRRLEKRLGPRFDKVFRARLEAARERLASDA
jgi:uncharacterized protein YndB with AHSA1/START domain